MVFVHGYEKGGAVDSGWVQSMTAASDALFVETTARDAIRRAHVASIRKLRDSLCEPLESVEWRSLPHDLKVVVILMAGMDDGHALKNFAEFTPPEKTAIKLQIRSMKRSLEPLMALSSW